MDEIVFIRQMLDALNLRGVLPAVFVYAFGMILSIYAFFSWVRRK